MITCPNCKHPIDLAPPEPEPDTWVVDRYGSPHHRSPDGSGWGQPGLWYLGEWQAMWDARGPFVPCAPWGLGAEA